MRILIAAQDEYLRFCRETAKDLQARPQDAPEKPAESEDPIVYSDTDEEESKSKYSTTIGQYSRVVHYEEGLFSTIYKASGKDGRTVALKVTRPASMSPPHNTEREIRILRAAATDRGIIPLLDTFHESGGRVIIVFPFFPHDLDLLFHRHHKLSLAQVKSHLRDLFRGLAHIHSLGIIHRDIKPSNILLNSPEGPAYIADFGISWMDGIGAEPTDKKMTDVGTTRYRPPELLFGDTKYGTELDLWAAGCTVAESLKRGEALFDAGPVGSELSLIQSIFSTLGTPDLHIWPASNLHSSLGASH